MSRKKIKRKKVDKQKQARKAVRDMAEFNRLMKKTIRKIDNNLEEFADSKNFDDVVNDIENKLNETEQNK